MAEGRRWPALVIEATRVGLDELVLATLDDYALTAIEDLAAMPPPPGGLWAPALRPTPEPPPAPLHWRVFFADDRARAGAAAAIARRFPEIDIRHDDVADENWAARSQQDVRAVRAGSFIVAPPWDRPKAVDAGVTVIVVEPSRGFGTGHHATTRLCLRALSEIDLAGRRVLDLGTGSGVLAMAAAFKGAREVLAVDVDPDAIDAARESASLNALPVSIEFAVADFRGGPDVWAGLKTGPYDLVVANLTGGMLISCAPRIMSVVAPGGVLIVSGFDESERETVRAAFADLIDRRCLSEDGWGAFVLRSSFFVLNSSAARSSPRPGGAAP